MCGAMGSLRIAKSSTRCCAIPSSKGFPAGAYSSRNCLRRARCSGFKVKTERIESEQMNKEMSETLVRTGPGTPMGNLLRRYWVPILLASEVAESDGPPVRAQVLGEKLIAFRNSDGKVGLVDEFCSHRGA